MQLPLSTMSLYTHKNFFVRPDGTPLWQFLSSNDIIYKKKHFPFLTTSESPKVRPVFNWKTYLSLQSRGEALAYLYQGFGQALNYVGPVLDSELKHGFNDHTDRHTLWVSQTATELLQRAGMSYNGIGSYNLKTELLTTLVGMTHDIGNFLGRKQHSRMSVWLLTRLFDEIEFESPEWQVVSYAILFHEEPELVESGAALKDGNPLQWALVAADKMHVGRDRVGPRSFMSGIKAGALQEDAHILVNALIVRSSWSLGVGQFEWHLDFSVDKLEEKFEAFSKGNNRLWLPRYFQDKFLGEGVRYRDTFSELLQKLYHDRLALAAESVGLLFPYIKKLRVELVDNDTRSKVGSGKRVIWQSG